MTSSVPQQGGSLPGQDRARILVVENEALVAEHVTRVLEAGGFVVPGIAATGRDALRQIDQHHPDLVVMDIALDGSMDGIDVGRALAASCHTPVVYLTAHCDEDTLRRAGLTNAAAYVVKPFTNQQLHSAVVMAVRQVRPTAATESDSDVQQQMGQGQLMIARTLQAMDAQAQSDSLRERRPELERLSESELDIVRHIAEGRRIPSIASLRGVSPHTVRNQIKAIFKKLEKHSQRELVDWLRTV